MTDDKRALIVDALEQHSDWSARRIATLLGLSHTYVGKVKKELEQTAPEAGSKSVSAPGRSAPATQGRKTSLPTGFGQFDLVALIDLATERLLDYYEKCDGTPDPVVAALNRLVRVAQTQGLHDPKDDPLYSMIESGKKWVCSNCDNPLLPGDECARCGLDSKYKPPIEKK